MPVRALQAMALAVWPLKWQYQVYHLNGNTRFTTFAECGKHRKQRLIHDADASFQTSTVKSLER